MREPAQMIALPEECNTQWAGEFHDLQALDATVAPVVRINASAVCRINTPAIQILLALARSVEARHGRFEIDQPSPAFEAAFADLGLFPTLTQWSTQSHG